METLQVTAIELAHDWGEGNGVLLCDGPIGQVKVKGPVAGFAGGQHLKLTGFWTDHKRFGRQFQAQSVKVGRATAGPGLIKWLARINGVGPATARAIIEHLDKPAAQQSLSGIPAEATDVLEVIENHPERLEEIAGIGPAKAKSVSTAVKKRGRRDQLCIDLENAGVPTAATSRVIHRFGDDAPDIVARAPYSLLRIRGIGFKTADNIARASGSVSMCSYERLRAGIIETLRQASGSGGHVFLPPSSLLKGEMSKSIKGACQLLGLKEGTIGSHLSRIEESGYIKIEDGAIYLAKFWRQEVIAAGRLAHLASAEVQPVEYSKTLQNLPGPGNGPAHPYSKEQLSAIAKASAESALVITGGPGTGKTTITRAIVDLYRSAGLDVELCAPTGRAAKRLSEATGGHGKTIHRLLEYNPRGGFARNRFEQLTCQAIIIDEFSMVDIELAARLFEAIPHGCRIIIVGDQDQLPSVGHGTVLRDIIHSTAVPVVRLETVFRQAAESMIIRNAHRFIREEPLEYPANGDSDFYFWRKNNPDDIKALLASTLLEKIPGKWGLDPLRDIMVLTPQNRGALGTIELNKHLQQLINPDGQKIGNRPIRVGDRVMQTRNNYRLEVFNGDVGHVLSWDPMAATPGRSSAKGDCAVEIGDRLVNYSKEDLGGLVPAYAATIHKSQGSEFPAVIGIIHSSHRWMLRMNLVYTMMTRAKRVFIGIGQRGALELAAKNRRDLERYSRLAQRLADPPDELPELDRAEIIQENVWTCDDCHHTWESTSAQVYACPECRSEESCRELKADN